MNPVAVTIVPERPELKRSKSIDCGSCAPLKATKKAFKSARRYSSQVANEIRVQLKFIKISNDLKLFMATMRQELNLEILSIHML